MRSFKCLAEAQTANFFPERQTPLFDDVPLVESCIIKIRGKPHVVRLVGDEIEIREWLWERVQTILRAAGDFGEEVEISIDGYAEPGYSDPACGLIALADWNEVTRWDAHRQCRMVLDTRPPRVAKLLERLGVEIEWSEEWTTCGACGRLIRTQPDSYSWKRAYQDHDGEPVCQLCVQRDPASFLKDLEGDSHRCNTLNLDLEASGYRQIEKEFEHGLHYGQDASPALIAKILQERGVGRFLFNLDSTGQFDSAFSIWVHESEAENLATLRDALANGETDGPSVAGACERALQDATVKMAQLDGPGVRYAKCNPDGTADVRLVSPEEFVQGIK